MCLYVSVVFPVIWALIFLGARGSRSNADPDPRPRFTQALSIDLYGLWIADLKSHKWSRLGIASEMDLDTLHTYSTSAVNNYKSVSECVLHMYSVHCMQCTEATTLVTECHFKWDWDGMWDGKQGFWLVRLVTPPNWNGIRTTNVVTSRSTKSPSCSPQWTLVLPL
jgi:hypothetical protein